MSRTPIDPSLIHDSDAEVASQAAFGLLVEAVLPHLTPVLGAKLTAEIRGTTFSEEDVITLTRVLGQMLQSQGASFAEMKKAMKEARERLRDPASITQEEVDEMVGGACDEAATVLVSSWANVLIIEGTEDPDGISLGTIDDAMLPPLDEQMSALFAESVGQTELTVDEARAILRTVRSGLKQGEVLPEPMVIILRHEGVNVTA
jgi:hypothetical protein